MLDIHNPSEVIEEDSLVSLFAGSSLVKGGSSSFLILGLIALAFYYIRQKKQNTSPPLPPPPPLPTSAPNTSHSSLPMETFSYSPVPPFNPSYLGRTVQHSCMVQYLYQISVISSTKQNCTVQLLLCSTITVC